MANIADSHEERMRELLEVGRRNLCRLHGRLKSGNIMWVWDYANDCAVHESEMPEGGERWRDSEAANRRLMEQAKPLTDQRKENE